MKHTAKRLLRLRQLGAPILIIKAEQIRLALKRAGKRWNWLNPSSLQNTLTERYLEPLRRD